MIDWEEIIRAESVEALKDAKLWLFQENIRLDKERRELTESRDKFLKERSRFQSEMDELNLRSVMERKRLREETLFFDKKMAILQDGFRQLEEDRKQLARERQNFARERAELIENSGDGVLDNSVAQVLFRNATNPLTLRKRYRDLVKIFHPDNLAGDAELVQLINREFARRKEE